MKTGRSFTRLQAMYVDLIAQNVVAPPNETRSQDCMIGLVYSDESEASSFMKIVTKKKGLFGMYPLVSSL